MRVCVSDLLLWRFGVREIFECVCVCASVCVKEHVGEREREREKEREKPEVLATSRARASRLATSHRAEVDRSVGVRWAIVAVRW